MVLSKKRITKALIRLRGCAGCSALVLFANSRRQVFSRRGPLHIRNEFYFCVFIDVKRWRITHKLSKAQKGLCKVFDCFGGVYTSIESTKE